ncbi:MFS transporter [Thalassobacillus sp. C254]|uniref:MFS transporter n=1 Tax=Thalassobacillus sp. C254 TaxID=1225341 RepID=UPI0006D1D5C3|nr:MFS transporter [Thalassobacillus sp. C254]
MSLSYINESSKQFISTFILFWCGLVILSSMYLTIPLEHDLSHTFGVSLTQAAWIGSSFSLCYAIGCLLYGPLSDRYGRKVFLVSSISILTAVTITLGFIESFYVLVLLRGIQGLAAAAFAPISLVYAGEMFPPQKRLTTVGYISSGLLMAGIIGQVVSGVINEYYGWHSIFFILGGIYFISTILVITLLPKDITERKEESILATYKYMFTFIKHKQFISAFSITFMLLLSLIGMYSVLGTYLRSEFSLSDQQILSIRAAGILDMLLAPFAGRIAQNIGVLTVLRAGLGLASAGLLALSVSPSLPLIIITSVAFTAGIAIVTPVVISLISQLAGPAKGSAISFNAFVLFLGASLGPILSAYLLKTAGYLPSILVLGTLLFGGFLLTFATGSFAPEKTGKAEHQSS